jgi:hypothetical protein
MRQPSCISWSKVAICFACLGNSKCVQCVELVIIPMAVMTVIVLHCGIQGAVRNDTSILWNICSNN